MVPEVIVRFGNLGVAEDISLNVFADYSLQSGAEHGALLLVREGCAGIIIPDVESSEEAEELIHLLFYNNGRMIQQEGVLNLFGRQLEPAAAQSEKLHDRHALPAFGNRVDGRDPADVGGFVVFDPVKLLFSFAVTVNS